jgi:DNA-binding transcriptional regulator LsrR (DeoR family)
MVAAEQGAEQMRPPVGENQEDQVLMARASWLYYIGGLNQEATAKRLGTTRARVNKLLSDARDSGLVSIAINPANVGLLPVEEAIRQRYGLDFCICTPALGQDGSGNDSDAKLAPRVAEVMDSPTEGILISCNMTKSRG